LQCATDLEKAFAIALHLRILFEPFSHLAEDGGRVRIRRFYNPVVHPLPVPPGCYNPGSPQVCQVARDFRLVGLEDFDEETDANLGVTHQVE
jgi:hypothetical protein